MEKVTVKAFAKVNMFLEVKGRRPDGFHEIETLFRGISLYDVLELTKAESGVSLACEGSGLDGVPERSNLAWRAADLFCRAFPDKAPGVALRLFKRIPEAAGLGGGSADAAAVLLGLDRLYGLGLEINALRGLAAELGSDVPFCLAPLAAVGRGRGEELAPLAPSECGLPLWVVIVKPPFGLSTKEVYGHWAPQPPKGVEDERPVQSQPSRLDGLLYGLRERKPELIWHNMVNDLESAAFAADGRLKAYREMIEAGMAGLPGSPGCEEPGPNGGKALLSGSGTAFAVYYTEETPARLLEKRLKTGSGLIEPPLVMLARTLTAEDIAYKETPLCQTI